MTLKTKNLMNSNYIDYWMKGLVKSYHSDDIITCDKGSLGQNQYIFAF